VTFGDSWPFGEGIELPYGSILSKLLKSTSFVNYSRPATSNEHQLLQLKDFAESTSDHKDTVAVFFITSPHRCLFFESGQPKEIYPWDDESKGPQSQAYFKYLHSVEIEKFRLNQTILALQKISQSLGLRDYYFSGWHKLKLDWPGIDLDKIWMAGQETAADWLGAQTKGDMIDWQGCSNVIPNDCHPNQQGHAIIAQRLADWISCTD
jgi:hypothetical protein